MFRIDGPGATQDGKFTEGDPANGTRATVVTDEWLNAVQEELVAAVENDGALLQKSDSGQLARALRSRVIYVNSIAELSALNVLVNSLQVSVSGAGAGMFRFSSVDLSSEVANDTQKIKYVPPDSDPTGATGAWVKQYGLDIGAQFGSQVIFFEDVAPLLSLDPANLPDGQQASIRDAAGQGWVMLEWDATSTLTADDVDVFQITGEPVGRWLVITREGAIKTYATEPASPPLFQMYIVSSPLTITSSGVDTGAIDLVFELELDPATVTNVGDGSGTLEFYNETTAGYVSGSLTTADNITYTFTPSVAFDRDDVIRVEPTTDIKSATGLAYSGQQVDVPMAIDIAWPYTAGTFDNNISARDGGSLVILAAMIFTAPGDITIPGVDVIIRSRKDAFAGTGQLKISLVELVDGEPTGTELGSVTLADFTTAGNAYEEFNLDFGAPVSLTDGVQYGLKYEVVSPSGDCVYQMPASSVSIYPGGGTIVSNSGASGGAWVAGAVDSVLRLGLV